MQYLRGRVPNFNQSEAGKDCFLAFDWLKFGTLSGKYRCLLSYNKLQPNLPQAITIPPLARWPTNPGFTVNMWVSLDPRFMLPNYKPFLYWYVIFVKNIICNQVFVNYAKNLIYLLQHIEIIVEWSIFLMI